MPPGQWCLLFGGKHMEDELKEPILHWCFACAMNASVDADWMMPCGGMQVAPVGDRLL